VKSATLDKKRRIVMPKECPPRARVTIEQLDALTWVVRLQPTGVRFKRVLIPIIDRLGSDPEWEREELRIARHVARRLKPEEE
jgi:bifunctional DNA-binding transcriptional regulator/antitoxin component of YhaV-PrlF toxin-antitoxin module